MQAKLALEDGTVYTGRGVRRRRRDVGEVVFNTSHDRLPGGPHRPVATRARSSTMTYPLIGNYGINADDQESTRPAGRGLHRPRAHPRPEQLPQPTRPRRLPASRARHHRHRRDRHPGPGPPAPRPRGDERRPLDDRSRRRVARAEGPQACPEHGRPRPRQARSCRRSRSTWDEGFGAPFADARAAAAAGDAPRRRHRLRHEVEHPALPHAGRLPGHGRARHRDGRRRSCAHKPDGVFLSNGPGDPGRGRLRHRHDPQGLLGKKPIFGICLGHQLLGLALRRRRPSS